MQKVFEHYTRSETGLLLLQLPTGWGKTHQILDFIAAHANQFRQQGRQIWFVTHLRKNLPHEQLYRRFRAAGQEARFAQDVLVLQGYLQQLRSSLPHLTQRLPEDLLRSQAYRQLHNWLENEPKFVPNGALSNVLEAKGKELEKAFRKEIRSWLKQAYPETQAREAAILDSPSLAWLRQLYPGVEISRKSIVFCTVKRLLLPLTDFIGADEVIYQSRLDRAVIFLDEVDAAKEVMRDHLIAQTVPEHGRPVDLLGLFLDIYGKIHQRLVLPSMVRGQEAAFEALQEEARQLFERYRLQQTCRTHPDLAGPSRFFLFDDGSLHQVIHNQPDQLILAADDQLPVHWIQAKRDEPASQDSETLRGLLYSLTAWIDGFLLQIERCAEAYRDDRGESADLYTLDQALLTVLNHFYLDPAHIQALLRRLSFLKFQIWPLTKDESWQLDVYRHGLDLFSIEDHLEHDSLTRFHHYRCLPSPEAILADICSQALVIGTSATALLPSNLGNFDVNWLRRQLGAHYHSLDADELQRLQTAFADRTSISDQVSLQIVWLGTADAEQLLTECTALFNEAALGQECLRNLTSRSQDSSKNLFKVRRYLRFLQALDYFLARPIQVMLCFSTRLARSGDPDFDLSLLEHYAAVLAEKHQLDPAAVTSWIQVLGGESFEADWQDVYAALGRGERRWILTSYQSAGAGQNLQYPVSEAWPHVRLNAEAASREMDIPAIYLDRPTNLLVNTYGKQLGIQDMLRYAFQLEGLVQEGGLSVAGLRRQLRRAVRCIQEHSVPEHVDENLYQSTSYAVYVHRLLIQAIGRMARTQIKAPELHLLADLELKPYLQRYHPHPELPRLPEYQALLETAGELQSSDDATAELALRTASASLRVNNWLHAQLRRRWSPERISQWQSLRDQLLKQPSLQDADQGPWQVFYTDFPEAKTGYWYQQAQDFGDIRISFEAQPGWARLDEATSRLPELMAVTLLAKGFAEDGFATHWQPGRRLMLPVVFNNLYKGALGEACGKILLASQLDLTLEALPPDVYERFDYRIGTDIFVDFKLWRDSTRLDREQEQAWIREKMASCGARKALIINLLSDSDAWRPIASSDHTLFEVPSLIHRGQLVLEHFKFIQEAIQA